MQGFGGKPEGKRALGRPRDIWGGEGSLGNGWGDMEWIDLAQDGGQMAGSCKRGNEPLGSIKYGEFLDLLRND